MAVRLVTPSRQPTLPDAARPGMVELGCFRLEACLGQGSYATVFLAEQQGLDRPAVVKIAHARLLDARGAQSVRARFAAEVRAATRVSHPNLVTVFAAGETSDGLPAIAMEYVPGATLEAVLSEHAGALPLSFVHQVFAQLGSALAAFHGAGVVHGDLSPTNAKVCDGEGEEVVVKVLDFGAAVTRSPSGRTSIVGTPRYPAPEQVVGTSSAASDVYALGAMLWWALCGEEFHGTAMTLQDVTDARLMGSQRADIRPHAAGISGAMADLVADMLAFEAGSRPTAEEFCARWADLAPVSVDAARASSSTAAIERFVGEAPEIIADLLEAIERRQPEDAQSACHRLCVQAQALGGTRLAQIGRACASLAAAGSFHAAAGLGDALESEYAVVFRRLRALLQPA